MPLEPPRADQNVERIHSGDVPTLLVKLRTVPPGTTLLLADGIYTLAENESLEVNTAGLTIRSASGSREAVMIDGGYNNISVNADDFTVADVTLRYPKFHSIQVRGERGISRTKIYHVHLVDAGQQFIKVSAGDGMKNQFADDGLVACSLIEYMPYSHGNSITPPYYTNGVDILAGKGWVIRDNVFRRIRSKAGPAGPAILIWKNAMDSVIQRNLILDSWRGIALGLRMPNNKSRGGASVKYDHQNGIVKNNVILALTEVADVAIETNFALNSRVFHNTIYYNQAIKHAVNWSIEYRFQPTTADIRNNLTNLRILKRQPYPTQEAVVKGNVTNAKMHWFRNLPIGDFHLVDRAPLIDKATAIPECREDIDGNLRPVGSASEVGADEYTN